LVELIHPAWQIADGRCRNAGDFAKIAQLANYLPAAAALKLGPEGRVREARMATPHILMTDARHYGVHYRINPWMQPALWAQDQAGARSEARRCSAALARALEAAGAKVDILPGAPGLPDMVFPANAAVVLDGKALMARFRHPERRREEPPFLRAFQALKARGVIDEVLDLPEGRIHEGAGDAHWDAARNLFWVGHGPRSDAAAAGDIHAAFGKAVVPLRLASERFYHLDTCFCPLSAGEVLYYPPAFDAEGLRAIAAHVTPGDRIAASDEDAAGLCVNAVCLGRTVIMAKAPARLKAVLGERGYRVVEVDLAPFLLSGGAAFCMTLRLDQNSRDALAARPTAA
jgi:N-dimethylarginine dimethylaminohydrolase